MYGEGNTTRLVEDITKATTQVTEGLTQSLGFDVKSVLAGALGAKIQDKGGEKEYPATGNTGAKPSFPTAGNTEVKPSAPVAGNTETKPSVQEKGNIGTED